MSIVMNMGNYRREIPEADAETIWSDSHATDLALNTLHTSQAAKTLQVSKMPTDLAMLDAELFLQRIYTYQR